MEFKKTIATTLVGVVSLVGVSQSCIDPDGIMFSPDVSLKQGQYKQCIEFEEDYQALKNDKVNTFKANDAAKKAKAGTFGYFETNEDFIEFIAMINEEKKRGNFGSPITDEQMKTEILNLK